MARMTLRQGTVSLCGRTAGLLEETPDGFRFTYDTEYVQAGPAIFHELPLQSSPFTSPTLFACFENLVSEGWLRAQQSATQRIDENDRFGLLLANGLDLTGAITVSPMGNVQHDH
ncbi:MAG: HipA N-terminal domain-containing protein [Natronospirillum sp.]